MIPTDFHIFQRGWYTTNQEQLGLLWFSRHPFMLPDDEDNKKAAESWKILETFMSPCPIFALEWFGPI